MNNEDFKKVFTDIDDLAKLQEIVEDIILYRKKLLNSKDNLNDDQKLFLLAYEASEARIEKMGRENTEKSKIEFIDSVNILRKFIKN